MIERIKLTAFGALYSPLLPREHIQDDPFNLASSEVQEQYLCLYTISAGKSELPSQSTS